jgi:DNA-binding transcriptional MocR family regulator
VKIHHSDSGYFLWLELPAGRWGNERPRAGVYISIAPGKMFSTCQLDRIFRFNTAWGWGEREEQG